MTKVMVLVEKLLEERTHRFLIPLVIVFLVLLTTSHTYAYTIFEFTTIPPSDAVEGSIYEYDFSVTYDGENPLSFGKGAQDTFGGYISESNGSSGKYTVDEVPEPGVVVLHITCTDSDYTIQQLAEILISPIPIPGAVWLLGSGLVCLVGVRKRFKK